jgi:hypothetical protein
MKTLLPWWRPVIRFAIIGGEFVNESSTENKVGASLRRQSGHSLIVIFGWSSGCRDPRFIVLVFHGRRLW